MSDAAQKAITLAMRSGADASDALIVTSRDLTASIRNEAPETIEQSEACGLGIRVFVGKRTATLSTSDLSPHAIEKLVENTVAIAKAAPTDPHVALADAALLAAALPELELADNTEPSMKDLQRLARECEAAGRSEKGITNSEGADASWGTLHVGLFTSHGVAHEYRTTHGGLSLSLIAGTGDTMQRDYAYSSKRFMRDIRSAESIGKEAALRTLRRMNPRKIASTNLPVIFEPRVGKQLLGAFAGAISGSAIARGTSFLKQDLGKQVFSKTISISDDPLIKRGLASRPCDGEGVAVKKQAMVSAGTLNSWFLDTRSANQLGMKTTGHASRSLSSAPHPSATNLYIEAGVQTPKALMQETGTALYITETFGHGVNLITGDYSQGASGFMVENGEMIYPVSEITIAGNLRELFAQLTAANDLTFEYGFNVPTLRVANMAVAGN
ncbi:MAG: TldD/PmbA family protein [Alphaproteobacteria bacterium]|nr:TldD/PmbA family protein [Alphaproteobacteria bacterium]